MTLRARSSDVDIFLPAACPGCRQAHHGDIVLAPVAWAAHARARAMGGLPPGVVVRAAPLRLTHFKGGKASAYRGRLWTGSLADLEAALRERASRVVAKGEGAYFVDAVVAGAERGRGRRRDSDRASDVLEWTARTLDCDGVPRGDWDELVAACERERLGVLFQRSSSHEPGAPKWHATIPFARGVSEADVAEWRRQDAWLCGWFSALAGLPGAGKNYAGAGKHAASCGLDLRSKSGNRGTPVFPAARRSRADTPPETFATVGGALDLEAFLRLSGYDEVRATQLAVEDRETKARRPRRSAGPAGDPSASLAALPSAARARAKAWASAHGGTYAACADRNGAALAIGGALGRRGVAAELAGDLVHALAVAGGLTDAGGRAQAARYSAENALAGQRTRGLTALRSLLGPRGRALEHELRELIDALAPDTEPEPESTPPRPRRPIVTTEAAQAWARKALEAPGRASLDRRGTGVGKSHGLAAALCEIVEAEPEGESVLVAFSSHAGAHEFEGLAKRVAAERGLRLPLAVVPRLARSDAEVASGEAIACLAGLADAYHAAAERGWNPIAAVCRGCRHNTDSKGRTHDGAEACAYRLEAPRAWAARIVLAQKAHISMPGFWRGNGARFSRLVVEEDASAAIVRGYDVSRRALDAFERVLSQARRWAMVDAERARPEDQPSTLARVVVLDAARTVLATIARELERADPPTNGAAPVELHVEAAAARALVGACDVDGHALEETLQRAADRVRGNTGVAARNLLPLFAGVARAVVEGQPLVALVVRVRDERELRVDVHARPPRGVSTLVLDATGDAEVLAVDLCRAVEVLEGGTGRAARVVQLVDRLWSRTWFGLTRAPDDDAPRLDTERLAEVAAIVAELARRARALAVLLVTYQALEEPLAAAVRSALPVRPRWGDPSRPRVEVRSMHFNAVRGSNLAREIGAELVVVVGTPEVPPVEVARRRLRLGPATQEELAEARTWVEGEHGRTFGWTTPAMQRSWASIVAAELAQAVGRGARGDWSPRGGTWVLSRCPIAEWVPDDVEVTTTRRACLDPEGRRAWRALTDGVGRDRLAEVAEVSEWTARRCVDAAREWGPLDHDGGTERPEVPGGALDKVTTGLEDPLRTTCWGTLQPGSHSTLEGIRLALRLSQRGLALALGRHLLVVQRWLSGERATPVEVLERARELRQHDQEEGDVDEAERDAIRDVEAEERESALLVPMREAFTGELWRACVRGTA